MTNLTYILLGITIILNSAASLLVKKGSSAIITTSHVTSASSAVKMILPALNPYTIIGLICLAFSFALYIVLLSKLSISVAQPMLAIVYIFIAIGAHYLFGEAITAQKIAGILVIIFGVYLISGTA